MFPRKSVNDWPFDLSGWNLLEALRIVRERMKDNEHYQKAFLLIQEARTAGENLSSTEAFALVADGINPEKNDYEEIKNVPVQSYYYISPNADNRYRGDEDRLNFGIERFMPVYEGIYNKTKEDWIGDLANKSDTEIGIRFWKVIAESLVTFAMSEVRFFEQYKEAFRLLVLAIESKKAAIQDANLELFTSEQIEFLVSGIGVD